MSVSIIWPVLTAVCAVGGVLIAQAVVIWAQHDRFAGEDARRWQAERRSLYAQLLAEADSLESRISRGLTTRDPAAIPSPHDDNPPRVDALTREIDLIGSEPVVEAAGEINVAATAMMLSAWLPLVEQVTADDQADGPLPWPEIDISEDEDRMRVAKVMFARAARAELLNEKPSRKRSFKLYPGVD